MGNQTLVPQHRYTPPLHQGLDIVYQDNQLLVLNKPAGLLSVPGRGDEKQDCLASRVQVEYPEALVVHRLDMATSGLVIMARNIDMQRQLGMLFAQQEINKCYLAIVAGQLEQTHGEINLPLITDWPNRPRQIVDRDSGKPACTLYNVVEYDPVNDTSRVELKPRTGRTHQLRVHLQAIGHPILGDRLYATSEIQQQADRLLLHASRLQFVHPGTGQSLSILSQAPF